jgi:hypothetical protein
MLFLKVVLLVIAIGISDAKPGLKQGGAACVPEPDYCMNGGTCYTQYTQRPVYHTTTPRPATYAPVTTPCATAPPTYAPVTLPPIITTTPCQTPQTVTTTCQPPVPVYTTQAPVQTTTQYVWVTQPVCGCQPQYIGDRCEEPVTLPPTLPPTLPATTHTVCVRPTEQPKPVQSRCEAVQCLNGGTCNEISVEPFTLCVCPAEYTGTYCETLVGETTTVDPYAVPAGGEVTHIPHCNFTIKLLNEGAYTARMRVGYKIDGVQQPLWTSANLPIIGNSDQVTIPWYSTDIIVSLERMGFNWAGIKQDTHINSINWCNKCYKVWNDVSNPKWDYMDC